MILVRSHCAVESGLHYHYITFLALAFAGEASVFSGSRFDHPCFPRRSLSA
jgi:hypothetical protein